MVTFLNILLAVIFVHTMTAGTYLLCRAFGSSHDTSTGLSLIVWAATTAACVTILGRRTPPEPPAR